MKQKILEWYPGFTSVKTQADGTTDKFVKISVIDKEVFEALQECLDLSQFFCQNHGFKNLPSTKITGFFSGKHLEW